MQMLELREVPRKGCDRVGHLEKPHGPIVASALVVGEDALGPIDRGAGEELRIDEGVGYSVSREWILEIACVTDERPAGPVGLAEEAHLAREPAVPLGSLCSLDHARQVRVALHQHPLVPGGLVSADLVMKSTLWNRDEYADEPAVGRDGAHAHTRSEVPVVSVDLGTRPVAKD